jgi:hypothetical protein
VLRSVTRRHHARAPPSSIAGHRRGFEGYGFLKLKASRSCSVLYSIGFPVCVRDSGVAQQDEQSCSCSCRRAVVMFRSTRGSHR